MGVKNAALALLAEGLSPLPIARAKKLPPIAWKRFQTTPATDADLARWFGPQSLGCVTGYGGLEVLDFDDPNALEPFLSALPDDLRSSLTRIARTPSGGAHVWYKRAKPAPNSKLARFEDETVRVETRGVGGLVVCPPTDGYSWILHGGIPELSESDVSVLWAVARSFDLAAAADPVEPAARPAMNGSVTAWDDYATRGDADSVLSRAGWVRLRGTFQGCSLWTRPGKDPKEGQSARWGPWRGQGERFYCWSSSAGVPSEKLLTLPALRAHLEFGGDYCACARALASEGYGTGFCSSPSSPADPIRADEVSCERPEIRVNGSELYAQLTELRAAVESVREEFDLFHSGGRVVTVTEDDEGFVRLEEAASSTAAAELSRHVRFYRAGSKGAESDAYPPKELVSAWLSCPDHKDLRRITMLCPGPTIRPDGTVAHRDGYDSSSGYFLTAGYERLDPLSESAADSVAWLDLELLKDFRFVGPADRANAFALLFLPFLRGFFSGPTPLHVVKSHTPGSGKGKLLQACLVPYFGKEVSLTPAPRDEDEMRKKIATKLDGGARCIVLDNVTRRMESESLDAALTSTIYEDRRLGSSSPIVARNLAVWAATLNNPALSTDLARRSVSIAIDPGVENPWTRDPKSFRHPSLESWIRDNLYEVRRRVLSVLASWTRAGCPIADKALGSFESYASVLGGVLEHAGIEGFLDNHAEAFAEMAEESAAWGALLSHLHEAQIGRFSTARLWRLLDEDPSRFEWVRAAIGDGAEGSQRRKLGWHLKRIEGRVFSGFFLKPTGLLDGNKTYGVDRVAESSAVEERNPLNRAKPTGKPTSLFEPETGVSETKPTADSSLEVGFSGFRSLPYARENSISIEKRGENVAVRHGETDPLKPTEPTSVDLDPFSDEALGIGGPTETEGDPWS